MMWGREFDGKPESHGLGTGWEDNPAFHTYCEPGKEDCVQCDWGRGCLGSLEEAAVALDRFLTVSGGRGTCREDASI